MKKLSKAVLFCVVLLILWRVAGIPWAPERETDLQLRVDGQIVDSEGMLYLQGRVMVRLDWLAEIMGLDMEQEKRKIRLTLEETTLDIKIYSSEAQINGERYKMSNAPIYEDRQVMVPMRSVVEAFGWVLVKDYELHLYSPKYWAEKMAAQ